MAKEKPNNLSVTIISFNEAANIEACIIACKKVTNDIIVVDSHSTDDTISRATQAGAKVYTHDWIGYGAQKNIAIDYASHDWILSVDADEVIDNDLINFLNNAQLRESSIYMFKLDDHIGDRKIRFSELRPKWKKRLFNRKFANWNERKVHEQLEYPPDTKLVKSPGRILHFSYNGFGDFEAKIEKYADLGAEQMLVKQESLSSFKKIFNPYFRFFRSYIIYLGFLEGKLGYKISQVLKNGLVHKYKQYESQIKRSK